MTDERVKAGRKIDWCRERGEKAEEQLKGTGALDRENRQTVEGKDRAGVTERRKKGRERIKRKPQQKPKAH